MLEEKEDFFEQTPDDTPKPPKAPKPPRLRPDDPLYYEQEESRWEHLKPSPYQRGPILWIVGAVVVTFCIIMGLYIYFFTPQVKNAVQYGYVENVQKEGKIFDTFEGVILPYKSMMDTIRPYDGDFVFSTPDDHLAAELRKQQQSGRPVRVEYKVYRLSLPWRGNSEVVVTAVDSIDPSIILPPDRRPEIYKK